MKVSQQIGSWYDVNKRYLPWREGKNPYFIWLSEIILQQTRVNQGMNYYNRFTTVYPTIEELASAPLDEVLFHWQGLGYYTRARNLHKAAQIIVSEYGGEFPRNYEQLLELPGIGEYSAAAIASLAFDKPFSAIDGNVIRVLARYFGIESLPDNAAGKESFRSAARELLDQKNPGRHNQAMIELGAMVCVPRNPNCNECPIAETCYAFTHSRVSDFPVKKKKNKVAHRYFYYLVIRNEDKFFLRKRNEGDIWALLYDFPLLETSRQTSLKNLIMMNEWKTIFSEALIKNISRSVHYKYILSHQVLHVWFLEINMTGDLKYPGALRVSADALGNYPFPRLIEKFLQERKAYI
jgi:A/G-specific adenine glycosylase